MDKVELKTAVIGDRGSVIYFTVVGMDVFETNEDNSPSKLLKELTDKGYGIIFITEDAMEENQDLIEMYNKTLLPAVIPVPGRQGTGGQGAGSVQRSVVKAAGADIFMKK